MKADRRVILIRHWWDNNQCVGTLMVVDSKGQPIFISACLERGDRDNRKNVSFMQAGTYPLKWEYSPKFDRMLWEVYKVPNRSECKVHPANFWKDLNGCVAPGINLGDINRDGYIDVRSSTATTAHFHRALKGLTETTIEIIQNENTYQ